MFSSLVGLFFVFFLLRNWLKFHETSWTDGPRMKSSNDFQVYSPGKVQFSVVLPAKAHRERRRCPSGHPCQWSRLCSGPWWWRPGERETEIPSGTTKIKMISCRRISASSHLFELLNLGLFKHAEHVGAALHRLLLHLLRCLTADSERLRLALKLASLYGSVFTSPQSVSTEPPPSRQVKDKQRSSSFDF